MSIGKTARPMRPLEALEAALQESTAPAERAALHVQCAQNCEELGDLQRCRYHCDHAVELRVAEPYPYKQLIIMCLHSHQYVDAMRVCDTVLADRQRFEERTRDDISRYARTWKEIIGYAQERKLEIEKMLGKDT